MPAGGWTWNRVATVAVLLLAATSSLGAALAPSDRPGPSEETALTIVPDARVGGTDNQLRSAIRDGYDRSPTFRALVDHLAEHKSTVRVHWFPALNGRLDACLLHRVAVAPDGARLLWVLVRRNEPSDTLVALIAHEPQHVHEVLDADVRSGPEMEPLFERLGERTGSHGRTRNYAVYETQAALDAQDRVKRELRSARPAGHANAR